MTPARTGKGAGNFEFDRIFPGVGRLRLSSGTDNLREFRRRDALLTKLFETSQIDLLKAIKRRDISIEQVIEHDRHSHGGESLLVVRMKAPLWASVEATLPAMGRSDGTRDRYRQSFLRLRRQAGLGDAATVAALQRLDWHGLQRRWGASPADWNRMRTAVSRFLTLFTGDKYSPMRREVMGRIPLAKEPEGRIPDLTPERFLHVLARITDDDVRAALMVLVLTAMRIGEYLSLDESCLQPGYRRIRIPRQEGNKTGGTITLGEEAWRWVEVAVPFAGLPVPKRRRAVESDARYRRIWRVWREARDAEGVGDVRLHDLRHCAGQWASDAGESDRAIGQLLRHSDPRMTARYTKQKDAQAVSAAVGRVLQQARGA